MNPARVWFVSSVMAALAACAGGKVQTVDPGHIAYVVPHHIAEGQGEGTDLPDGGTPPPSAPPINGASSPPGAKGEPPPAAPPPPLPGSAPDPEPLKLAEQFQYQLLLQNNELTVEGVEARTLPKPVATPRRIGRFALELWIGRELIDRVRFDFPLLGAEERPGIKRRPLHDPPSLTANAIARVRVNVPNSPRATRLVLVDRAAGTSRELQWPPAEKPMPVPAAGAAARRTVPHPQQTLAPSGPLLASERYFGYPCYSDEM